MSIRISTTQWIYFKENNSNDIESMDYVDVIIEQYNFFSKRVGKSKKVKKTNIEKFGNEFGQMLNWIEDNCSEPFFAKLIRHDHARKATMRIFFFDSADAMAFKLVIS